MAAAQSRMAVDEERGEMFMTIQHDGAIQTYKKSAENKDNAIRLLQGNKTQRGSDASGGAGPDP